jgi:hypothetical protein
MTFTFNRLILICGLLLGLAAFPVFAQENPELVIWKGMTLEVDGKKIALKFSAPKTVVQNLIQKTAMRIERT